MSSNLNPVTGAPQSPEEIDVHAPAEVQPNPDSLENSSPDHSSSLDEHRVSSAASVITAVDQPSSSRPKPLTTPSGREIKPTLGREGSFEADDWRSQVEKRLAYGEPVQLSPPSGNASILPVTSPTKDEKVSGAVGASGSSAPSSRFDMVNIKAYQNESPDMDWALGPQLLMCFMTGWIDAVGFSTTFVWVSFQTGNTVQLAIALARVFSGPNHGPGFTRSTQQALTALLGFCAGSIIGRLGDHMGPKSRRWITLGTFLTALLTLFGALSADFSHTDTIALDNAHPTWTDWRGFFALAFAAASMGLQGVIGTRLGGQVGTTVVFTSVWIQLWAEPALFQLMGLRKARDYKILAILALFVGGLLGRVISDSRIGLSGALYVGAAVRLVMAIMWQYVPKAVKKSK